MCLDDKTISAYIDGELGEPWKTQVEEHLLHCSTCRQRYDQLELLEEDIQAARIQDEEFSEQQSRVWNYLKKHVITEEPTRFFKRRFYIPAPVLMGAAAALVLLFAVNFMVFRDAGQSQADGVDTIPVISSAPEEERASEGQGEMVQVSASDSSSVARTLEDLSVEQILKILDERGFEVDLRLKDVQELPASFEYEEQEASDAEDMPGSEDVEIIEETQEDQEIEASDESPEESGDEEVQEDQIQ
ncbi:MAG: anti-sigma factor family protein [Spirochaetota bacterium]